MFAIINPGLYYAGRSSLSVVTRLEHCLSQQRVEGLEAGLLAYVNEDRLREGSFKNS